jgi:hypothetical protein
LGDIPEEIGLPRRDHDHELPQLEPPFRVISQIVIIFLKRGVPFLLQAVTQGVAQGVVPVIIKQKASFGDQILLEQFKIYLRKRDGFIHHSPPPASLG